MAEEKTLPGLKGEEGQTSSGTGQPETNAPPSPEEREELEEEIERILEENKEEEPEKEIKAEVYGEEVVLPKEEWERIQKLLKDRENYKKATLILKNKIKQIKGKGKELSAPLTRQEYLKMIEKEAIEKACENPDIAENWDKIMEYYVPKHGRETVSGILKDIERAYKLFRLENPREEEKTLPAVGAETKKPTGVTTPTEGRKKGGILPRPEPIENWYRKKAD